MNPRSTLLLLSLLGPVLCPATAVANCVISDLSDCACDTLYSPWPFTAIEGDLVGTARLTYAGSTTSIRTSCAANRGQPYWQIQQYLRSPEGAHSHAHDHPDYVAEHPAQAWCTETVAYWHLKARVPYTNGYSTSESAGWRNHWPSSYVTNTEDMRLWYKTEEMLRDWFGLSTRALWIDGSEIDYESFEPGVNGPCPGAYQQLEKRSCSLLCVWSGSGTSHSQVIDSMIVYRTGGATGPVDRIDLRVIEGNIGTDSIPDTLGVKFLRSRIKNSKWYNNVVRFTTLGDTTDSSGRKIRGWGIDLDAAGDPVFDASRIRTIVTYLSAPSPEPTGPDSSDDGKIALFQAYHGATQGNITVVSNSTQVQTGGTIAHPTNHWQIAAAPHPVDPVYIDVDLLAQHPTPVQGVTLDWKDGKSPFQYQVWWAGQDQQIHTKTVTKATGSPPPPPGEEIPDHVSFAPDSGFGVRYVRLCFANAVLTQPLEISAFHFNFIGGAPEDSNGSSPDEPDDAPPVGVEGLGPGAPPTLRLLPSTPNPFHSSTTLAFEAPPGTRAAIELFDTTGRLVRRFTEAASGALRRHVVWDGRDGAGRPLPSGVYVYELRAGSARQAGTVTLLR